MQRTFDNKNLLFNLMDAVRFEWNFGLLTFKLILVIDGWDISCEIAFGKLWVDFKFNFVIIYYQRCLTALKMNNDKNLNSIEC